MLLFVGLGCGCWLLWLDFALMVGFELLVVKTFVF